ncbi:PPE family protein [Mycobacterium ulcerans str. Harvey]|uniref:PPE family protein n=1 Tax=Mycobacterium ulcerans str. Harvey TaxID=1299332 RepID=A0ABN0QMQ5_MYCUL|nr:PPE family protein [Mycobacterium ulcerans str. Harvey]
MYAGAGAGPMMAASAAWNGLAVELGTTAASYESVITRLTTESWMGPASMAMIAAAQPYLAWLTYTSEAAMHAGAQAAASAAAYEAAFAMTVPPPVVAANRSLLAALVATNFLGINTRRSWQPRRSTPRCGRRTPGDVRLRGRFLDLGIPAAAEYTAADHQPGRARRTVGGG